MSFKSNFRDYVGLLAFLILVIGVVCVALLAVFVGIKVYGLRVAVPTLIVLGLLNMSFLRRSLASKPFPDQLK